MCKILKIKIAPVESRIARLALPLHSSSVAPISQKSHLKADHISHQTVTVGGNPSTGHRHINSKFLQQQNRANPLRAVYLSTGIEK